MATLPRLVATDLDGTIVRRDGLITARTLAAFDLVRRSGAQFVFVTGRPPRLMDDVKAAFGPGGVAICSNGALIVDLATDQVVEENAIEPEVAAEAARRLREVALGIGIAVEYARHMCADDLYEPWEWDCDIPIKRLSDAELFRIPAPKLVGRHPKLSADELLVLAAGALAPIVHPYHSNGSRLIEAVAAGTSKASALARYAAKRGIAAAEVIAFGDMPNDLSMLRWAGTSYGMADAHPDVSATVDHVIPAADEDGVAITLELLFRRWW